jgi:hypothetical protein
MRNDDAVKELRMKRWTMACIFVVVGVTLGGCRSPIALPSGHERPLPTIGPLQNITGTSGDILLEITAPTNCAEIGDQVTFTGRITNKATYPVTIITVPLVDFVISPANWRASKGPKPIQRWSQTNQYPQNINPILAPGEQRTYQWHWTADAVYGEFGVNGVQTQFVVGEMPLKTSSFIGGIDVWVGVRTIPGGESSESGIACADMRRP